MMPDCAYPTRPSVGYYGPTNHHDTISLASAVSQVWQEKKTGIFRMKNDRKVILYFPLTRRTFI
ncbi:hypothetical protein EJQ74_19165 [Salmonella enterica]|nr:hypothetical protein [Salmonella enterica]ECD0158687.1 hypothetical protein [Salmonella enterica subsp. enterica]EAT1013697.1 hypothetical protein [Salmonella enterica]EAT1808081.1 hypothetical protein [Salmonella enterica]EBN0645205.1 hypothetical protein [Salmonella enterica]